MRVRGLTVLPAPGAALHWTALALAAAAVSCGLRRLGGDRVATGVAVATGVVMLAAMADTAAGTMLLGAWTPLAWTGALLGAGIAAAWAGRRRTAAGPGADGPAEGTAAGPLHLLHVTCLPVMAALTAAMAQHATPHAVSPGAAATTAHQHGDVLTGVAMAAAAVHVIAGCAVVLGRRGRRLDRAEALAGAGSVAAMAAAALL